MIRSRSFLVHFVTLLEAVHTSAGIHQFLTTGEEGVTLGADFDSELTLGRAAQKGLATSAAHDTFAELGMRILFHA